MAQWKKVIVSGSTGVELADLTLDTAMGVGSGGTGLSSIGSDNFLVGNGATSFTTVGSNGSGTVVRTSGATGAVISGSFSGSFEGDGSNLSGVSADSTFNIEGDADVSAGTFNTAVNTLRFDTASNHGFSFATTDATTFEVTLTTPQDLQTTANVTFNNLTTDGVLTANGNVTLGNASGDAITVNGATITTPNIPTGTDNTVVVVNSSNQLVTDEIDSRVWGSTLVDNAGGNAASSRIAYWSGGDSLQGNSAFTFDGTNLSVGNSTFGTNVVIDGNLTVNGDTFNVNVTNVDVEDKFILLNSGSATGDGGIIVQTEAGFSGSAFAWDDSATRFGLQIDTKLGSNATAVAPDAYVAAVVDVDGGLSDIAAHQQNGNIKIESGEIYIYA